MTDRELLESKGLDPEKYLVGSVTTNEWGSTTDPSLRNDQIKVHFIKKKPLQELILPARTDGPKWKPPKPKQYKKKSRFVVFCGDQHAPYHDPQLHKLFLQFLDEHKPDQLVLLGDGGDYPTVSRHQPKPTHYATVQECINGQHQLYRDYREAVGPRTVISALEGNHEERLKTFLLNQAKELYGISKATDENLPSEAVLSLRSLLRLDELGIELTDNETANYENDRLRIEGTDLVARHGNKAAKGSGASAYKQLDSLDHSIVNGHSHRQGLLSRMVHLPDGSTRVIWACEAGAMCSLGLGDSYTSDSNWAQGFATATVEPDGAFALELATYSNGRLSYRGNTTVA